MKENETIPFIQDLKDEFHSSADFQYRKFICDGKVLHLCYLDTMIDSDDVQTHLLQKIIYNPKEDKVESSVLQTMELHSKEDCIQAIIDGNVAIIYGEKGIAFSISQKIDRSIEESSSERVIAGTHDSFVESLKTNTTLIRKRIRSKELVIKNMTLGSQFPTTLSLFYINTLIPKNMIEKLEKNLKTLESKPYVESIQVHTLLEESPFSPFPQVMRTERPDRTFQHLLKGKPAIILDNDPNALLFPSNLYSFFQSPEDFNLRWLLGVFFYAIRIIAFWMSVLLPAFYIAVTAFHSNILPIGIFYTLKLSVENVPLPPLLEALTMQIFLELLREASLRLPQAVGSTIGTVGAIVIGTSIVQTNLISNSMIVVIALTAVASFTIPVKEMSTAARLIGLPLTILASIFGFLGISFGMLMIVCHLSKIKLFGERYVENPGFKEFTLLNSKKVKKHD
ncbi:spore germination protein [Bacillus sp. UNCCL81]|uniref:spore germination protein n=1 Tax=Bacillus sp. UNCCL81 TaxID=1502755 RepID=UPI0008EEE175|nr:spore germination protein [Bacillus sp. UNCCL81]SFD37437.1 spore germination protein KA [Bacillus sp. UNCCL81]